MPRGDVETFHDDGQWKNRREGTERAFSTHKDRNEAVAIGREEARTRGIDHIIRDLDGTIGERSSYGPDPRDGQVPRDIRG
ncbi:DUF2188 domain-containing protein [Occultella gossypii]|uniref:DUF2188 domain-containing protein n=1 Tax=Occultella gossypii TaxID=2800820 RepID=A0ABS7S693_9MICO|nr:DUF2188 domain-containing protein [Occultella gossypii]MBZ2195388.1 DUF2188 domain-containing protein [Occultella gossypii]